MRLVLKEINIVTNCPMHVDIFVYFCFFFLLIFPVTWFPDSLVQ